MNENKPPSQQPMEEQGSSRLEQLELELLLEGLYRMYGYDYRNYVRNSVARRVKLRLGAERLPTITALLDRVLHDPATAQRLMQDFSIPVTEMFRDPLFFYAFRTKVIPQLRRLPEVRIWHAGCSSGEEVYSMAILLEEEGLLSKTKIYATDINETMLERARTGAFPLNRMQAYTTNYIRSGGMREFSSYYDSDQVHAHFNPELIQHALFVHHNLVTDRSFNEFHVIVCRNVMIYFDLELQSRVHDLFYESLAPSGILALGSKESLMLSQHRQNYRELDGSQKIYQTRK
ncbi:CheR family methyltransferase [Paenibacillus daejeonensis]|uniref:CheR family methyltransferase n=1 Tax=Paenibacillus daejeonensis TaxID=135193 RepID=UPI00035DB25F|nr:protein-glutamate O-methyltransferase CheR [Paenibacillus daejeonensis]